MSQTLEQFAKRCHDLLKAEPGPAGRQKVCELLKEVLVDDTFVARHLDDSVPERKIIYEDAELGFCILAHRYEGAKQSNPHDHGPSWAIYGQAVGETEMSDFERVEAAAADKPGKARRARTYTLKPGAAHLYNEGDLHAPRREGATRLIRIEGTNMDKVKRLTYQLVG
jgi:hypothetical protein